MTFETTVTFTEADGKTGVTMRQFHPTLAIREHKIHAYNAVEGAKQTFARLAEYLRQQTGR